MAGLVITIAQRKGGAGKTSCGGRGSGERQSALTLRHYRAGARHNGTCGGDHVRHQILKSLPEQEILRIEIEIQALPGDSRCLSDVVHGCFLEAVPQELRCRGHENGLALWRAWRPAAFYVHRSVPL